MTILVAAFGSAHGADNLAWLVADSLQRGLSAASDERMRSLASRSITVKKYLHPSASLAELSLYQGVVFLDAMLSDKHDYGEIISIDAQQLEAGCGELSTHQKGLNDAIHLSVVLGTLPDKATVVAMNVHPHPEREVTALLQNALLECLLTEIGNITKII